MTNTWHYRRAGPRHRLCCCRACTAPDARLRGPAATCSAAHLCRLMRTGLRRLAGVNLVDAQLCTDAGKYVAALLASLSTMLHLELPHVNLLSKADLVPSFGELDFDLTFYLEVGQHAMPCGAAACRCSLGLWRPGHAWLWHVWLTEAVTAGPRS